MTRTIRRGADGAGTPSAAEGVERGSRDASNNHDKGGRASARIPTARGVLVGQFAVGDDRMVKLSIHPAGRDSKIEIRMHSRSGGLYFPTSEGVVLPIPAAVFIGGHLANAKKLVKTIAGGGA